METWRGASTPRDCEDPPRLHRMPVQEVQKRSRSRATVGRSYTPWVPASCQPRPEGSHPAPARATASARRLEPAATVPISMNPGARGLTHRRSIPVAPNARRHRPVASATATLRTMSQTLSLHTTPGWGRRHRTRHSGQHVPRHHHVRRERTPRCVCCQSPPTQHGPR